MPSAPREDESGTNPSIFLRLAAADRTPREIAWSEFERRYARMIAGFARRVGARGQDVDDVVQDVLIGFFALAPTFKYDPSKGRFRRYLKICAYNAVCRRFGHNARIKSVPLASLPEDALEVEQIWSDVWESERLARALREIRRQHDSDRSWCAFELSVIQGKAVQEVATELGVTSSAVYKARDRIGEKLRSLLHELERDEG
jgi:RNA polymerase sigma-70 factor (ECF subfamily)